MRGLFSFLAIVAISLTALLTQANAQEPEKWRGLYAGFYGAYAFTDDDYVDSVFGSQDLDLEGRLYGLVAGYNFRLNQVLIGIEVDGALADVGDDADPPCAVSPCRLDWNNLGTFRGRLGWIFGEYDQHAIYVTGGYATSGWDYNGVVTGVDHFVLDGWVIGGGWEGYLLNTNWLSTKLEYNYIDFGDSERFAVGSVDFVDFETNAHLIKWGMLIHF